MRTRRLGKDGPHVPVICFGALPIGGLMGSVPEDQAVSAVHAAIDVGMTFIDTAEAYRTSEGIVGRAIEGRRHQVFLATKVSGEDHSAEHIDRAVENSLRALGTDYIDLYQIHHPQPQWPIEQTMEHLVRLRDRGKVRHLGISNFSAEQTLEALQYGPIESSQPRYNMLFREAEESVLPCCLENGVGVISHSVLAKGLLSGRYVTVHDFASDDQRSRIGVFRGGTFETATRVAQRLSQWARDHGRDLVQLAIAWTLAHPAVTSAIVGAKTQDQVLHVARAADWELSQGDRHEIGDILGGFNLIDWDRQSE